MPAKTEYDFRKDLDQLIESDEFRKLQNHRPPLNIFSALGITSRELSHSDLLAYFLKPGEGHSLGDAFLREFLLYAFSEYPISEDKDHAGSWFLLSQLDTNDVVVRREWKNIDLTIELPKMNLIIGVENKIWASEGAGQVKQYQDRLTAIERYSNSLMVFLTPYGRPPSSDEKGSNTPCVCISWKDVGSICAKISKKSCLYETSFLLLQIDRHVKEDLMGDTSEKDYVRSLLKNSKFAETIRKIRQHSPGLSDIEGELRKACDDIFGCHGYDLNRHPPKQGAVREWKIVPLKLKKKYGDALPVFMVYHYPEWTEQPRPGFLLVVHDDDKRAFESRHREVNVTSDLIAPEVSKLGSWNCWNSLMNLEGTNQEYGQVFYDESFGSDFMIEVRSVIEEYFDAIGL